MIVRRYTFKLQPRPAQLEALEHQRALHSRLYNAAIEERIGCYRATGKALGHYDQCKAIKIIRRDDPEYAALGFDSMTETLARVDRAFKAFFRRAKQGAGARSGFPRFHRLDGFGFGKHGSGWRFDVKANRLYVKGVPGLIRARGKLPAHPSKIGMSGVMFREGRWWLSLVVELPERMKREADQSSTIRFDLIDRFAVQTVDGPHGSGPEVAFHRAADGRIVPVSPWVNQSSGEATPETGAERGVPSIPAAGRMGEATPETGAERGYFVGSPSNRDGEATPETGAERGNLVDLQQTMARCKRGSNKYRRLKLWKARVEARQARQRRERLHEWTTTLARQHARIVAVAPADLVAATASGRGTARDHGAAVGIKAAVNRAALDQGAGYAMQMLAYKLAERDGMFERVADEAPPIEAGAAVVKLTKAARRARRAVKHAEAA